MLVHSFQIKDLVSRPKRKFYFFKAFSLLFEVEGSSRFCSFCDVFFRGHSLLDVSSLDLDVDYHIRLVFGGSKGGLKFHGPNKYFTYDVKLMPGMAVVSVDIDKCLPVKLRDLYKLARPGVSVIGTDELYLSLLRVAFFEPVEFYLSQFGWSLVHGALLRIGGKVVLVVGGSKYGKSTLVDHIKMSSESVDIYSDNYAFVNGGFAWCIPEPRRGGPSLRVGLNFYGRTISGEVTPLPEPCFIDDVYIMSKKRGENTISALDINVANQCISHINLEEREGVFFSKVNYNAKCKYSVLDGKVAVYSVEVAQGLENNLKIAKVIVGG
jgi:hypothetical protein